MLRAVAIGLLLLTLLLPVASADEFETIVFQWDADELDLRVERRLTGQDAADLREEIDDEGNGDGTVSSAEVSQFNARHRMTFTDDQSDCFEDFDAARIDGKTPVRIRELSDTARDATGPVSSTATAIRIESAVLQFPNPSREGPTARLRVASMESMTAIACAMSGFFGGGNFNWGDWGSGTYYDGADQGFGAGQSGSSSDPPMRVEPRTGASMSRDSIRPTSLQALWNGRGLLADTDPEREALGSATLTFTVTGGATVEGFEGFASGKMMWAILGGAVIVAAAGAAFATEYGRYQILKWLILVPGFTRLEKDEVLDHDKREQLYQFIKTNPGPSFSDLRRELELSNGTLVHHLRILESQEYVKAYRDGFRTRFYIRGPKVIPTSYLTRTQQSVLDAIGSNPGLTQKDLSHVLGLPRESVSYHTKRLAQTGQLEVKQDGKWRRYWVKPPTNPVVVGAPGAPLQT